MSIVRDVDIDRIVFDTVNVTDLLETTIKAAYFDEQYLEYKDFLMIIESINNIKIKDIDRGTGVTWGSSGRRLLQSTTSLTLQTRIECDAEPAISCAFVIQQSQNTMEIANKTQSALREYFDNDELLFSVVNTESMQVECKDCAAAVDGFDVVLLVIGSIVALLVMTAFTACLFNKRIIPRFPGSNIVDDARWTALVTLALQFW